MTDNWISMLVDVPSSLGTTLVY